jgi:hypothetical protein
MLDGGVDSGLGLIFGGQNLAQKSQSENESDTNSTIYSESWATTETEGSSFATAKSKAKTTGESLNPIYEPQMGQEPQAPIYRTVEEQIFRATQFLASLPDRHCVVRIVGESRSTMMVTRTIHKPLTTPEWTEAYLQILLNGLEFALPLKDAVERINARAKIMITPLVDEPPTVRRKVPPPRSS